MLRFASILFCFFQLLINCRTLQVKKSISGICIKRDIPIVDTIVNNKWTVRKTIPGYTKLYFYENLTIAQVSISIKHISIVNGVQVSRSQNKQTFNTIIYSDSFNNALLCDSNNLLTAKLIDKDSLLKNQWAFQDFFAQTFESTFHKLISSKKDVNGDKIEENSWAVKNDTTFSGIWKFRFSSRKFQDIPYSLSKRIEKIKSLKLIEYTVTSNPRNLGNGQLPIDKVEMPVSMSSIKVENEIELMEMFRFAKEKLK
jgi:hypothetical protein